MQQVTSVVGATKRNRLFIYFYDYTAFGDEGKGMCIGVDFIQGEEIPAAYKGILSSFGCRT
jgi:hypothetical protein